MGGSVDTYRSGTELLGNQVFIVYSHKPSNCFEIIKGRHSWGDRITFSPSLSNTIDKQFEVINWIKLSNHLFLFIEDNVLHVLINPGSVIIHYSRRIVKGFVTHSESLYVGGCVSLGNVLRLQFLRRLSEKYNTNIDLFLHLIKSRVFHSLILFLWKTCGKW